MIHLKISISGLTFLRLKVHQAQFCPNSGHKPRKDHKQDIKWLSIFPVSSYFSEINVTLTYSVTFTVFFFHELEPSGGRL